MKSSVRQDLLMHRSTTVTYDQHATNVAVILQVCRRRCFGVYTPPRSAICLYIKNTCRRDLRGTQAWIISLLYSSVTTQKKGWITLLLYSRAAIGSCGGEALVLFWWVQRRRPSAMNFPMTSAVCRWMWFMGGISATKAEWPQGPAQGRSACRTGSKARLILYNSYFFRL